VVWSARINLAVSPRSGNLAGARFPLRRRNAEKEPGPLISIDLFTRDPRHKRTRGAPQGSQLGNAVSALESPMLQRLTVFLLVTLATIAHGETLRIGKVSVNTLDVFSPEEAARGWVYGLTNAAHMQTREAVVRRLLLFREGDLYEREDLAQTERNLRSLPFLKSASVTVKSIHDGRVDVDVTTQDSWTTEPGFSFGSKGGRSKFGFDLAETNFLGTGREISLHYAHDPDRTRRAVAFRDPSFFAPYVSATALYSKNSDGAESTFEVDRPFFALDTPWSAGLAIQDLERTDKLYTDSFVSSEFDRHRQRFFAEYGLALRTSQSRAQRLTGGVEWLEDLFHARIGDVPENRNFRYLFTNYQVQESRFIKANYVNRDLRFEDFNVGMQLSLRLATSLQAWGADENTGLVALSMARGRAFGSGSFILPKLSFETRLGTPDRNQILATDVHFVHRFPSQRPQTFVARAQWKQGWDLDRDVQFYADGDNGLRGYRSHAFEGDMLLIVNAEHRIFLGQELWQVISPGAAIFVDAGAAGDSGIKTDAGIGLRVGLTRTPKNMLRVDFAWPFNPDPRGERGLLISVSSSQAF
jgi:surface antigen-like variable number repeat protein